MKRRTIFLSILINTYILMFISFLFIRCNRDNPFDINSINYIAGKKPHVNFADTLITGYLFDTVKISINWADTTIGGKPGAIKKLYIDWNGNGQFSDSVNVIETNPLIISKSFDVKNNRIKIKATDFNGDTSVVDSAWLEIKKSTPRIISVQAPVKVNKNTPFTINLNSTDTGGVIVSYLWAVDEKTFSRTTDTNSITLTFDQVGDKTIQIKARDNKKIESDIRVISIHVIDPSDTSGPQITFLSPLNGDTVHTRQCVVSLQLNDGSGINGVTLNNATTMQQVGSTWRGIISLKVGDNVITATAIDKKGFKSDSSIHVRYDAQAVDQTPPLVTLLSPVHWVDTINTGTLIVRLLAYDESGVAGVFFNNEQMNFDIKDSSYSTTQILQEGLNRFAIRSVDMKGNSKIDSLSVFWEKDAVDNIPPVITIYQPRYLQHIADSVVNINGLVTDASGISSVKVNGVDAVLNYPLWNASCKLNKGYDTITVIATDSSRNRNSSEKPVVVIRNQSPRFKDVPHDTFVAINSVTTFSATAEDDDNSLSFSITRSSFAVGTVSSLTSTLNKTTFTYTSGIAGIDTFKLTATDPWGDIDTAVWHVKVLAPSDSSPIFIISAGNLPDTITALDTCRESFLARDPFKKPLTYSVVNGPSGIHIDNSSGNITYVPGINDTGAKVIVIQVSNGDYTNTITWNVRVISVDKPPKFSSLGNQTTNANQKIGFTLNATDENNDQLEFLFGSTIPVGAVLDSNRFSWTPSFTDAGDHKIVFVVREKNRIPSLSDTLTITITVNKVNQKPVFTNPGTISGVANQQMSLILSATDPDNDPVSYSMINAPIGSSISGNKFIWTPSKSDTGIHLVKFTASDGSLSDTMTVTIKINTLNHAPSLTNPGNKSISENQVLQFTLAASDPDNDSLIYTMENAPTGSNLTGNVFSWRPGYTQSGTYSVRFIVSDNIKPPMSDSQTITITVNNVNAPPVLTSPGNQRVNENERLSFTLSATDIDNDSLTYSMSNAPQGAVLDGKNFTWTPTYTQSGTYKVTFYVKDNAAQSLSDSQSITITVIDVNRPPVFTDSTSKTVNENATISFQLLAYDPDGSTPRYTSPNLPSGATLDIYGIFKWTPNYDQAGSYRIKFIALDSTNTAVILRDTATITINVNNVNRPPVFTDSSAQSINQNKTLTFQLQAYDPDGSRLYFSSTNLPNGAFLSNDGTFTWTPTLADAWHYKVTFIVRDSSNASAALSDTATIDILVKYADPSMPSLLSPANGASSQPTSITFKWTKSTGTTNYYLQIATDTGFTQIFFKDSTLTDTVKTISGLANGTNYYWRVNALNGFKQNGWTDRRSLRTIQTFPLIINANNGSVTTSPASGPYDSATTVTLTAIPNKGYSFASWNDDASGVSNPTTVKMDKPKTVTAIFDTNTYSLNTSSSQGGSVSIPASPIFPVKYGVPTPIKATPFAGFHFVNWTITTGNVTIANFSSNSTTATLTSDASIMANFSINTYNLTVTKTNGGSITSPTSFPITVDSGAPTTITAAANSGYRFVNWTITSGSATLGNANSISTTVTLTNSNAVVQANFIKTYSLTTLSGTGGSITSPVSPLTVDSASSTPIIAAAGSGYRFVNWTTSGGAIIGNTTSISTTVILKSSDATVQANFVKTYSLTTTSGTGGSITSPVSPLTVDSASSTPIIAAAGSGYRFVNWTTSGSAMIGNSTSISTTVILKSGDATVQANFVKTYSLTTLSGTGGSITSPVSPLTVDSATSTPIKASANSGYRFVNWTTSGGAIIGNSTSISTTVILKSGDATVQANFVKTYSLTTNSGTGGSINVPTASTITVDSGVSIAIKATAGSGYRFVNWNVTSGIGMAAITDSTLSSTSVTLTGDATVQANFVKTHTLTLASGPGGSVTNPGSSIVDDNTPISISATSDVNHTFSGWTVTDYSGNVTFNSDSTITPATVILTGNATIQANFQ